VSRGPALLVLIQIFASNRMLLLKRGLDEAIRCCFTGCVSASRRLARTGRRAGLKPAATAYFEYRIIWVHRNSAIVFPVFPAEPRPNPTPVWSFPCGTPVAVHSIVPSRAVQGDWT